MNILIATSEAVPFAKTGGLADVCGSLPVALQNLGQQVAVIMPAFRSVYRSGVEIEPLDVRFSIPIGNKTVEGSLERAYFPDSQVPVYFVRQDDYYDRDGIYQQDGVDYKDNCERFAFFSRAVIESVRLLNLQVDVLHSNDWTTGLIPAYLETEYQAVPNFEQIGSLFTIHNLAYQGVFWHWDMVLTGLDWKYFNWHQMEFFGNLNLMKTGLAFADSINTVSPRYAQEIQSSPLGCGLEGLLQHRREDVSGIVNGIDYRYWDPSTDENLPAQFGPHDYAPGKATCKADLQNEMGLPQNPHVPLLGMIGRLCEQKGFELVAEVISKWVNESDAQWVILGTGEQKYHDLFSNLAERFPNKVAVRLEFSNALAHRIEAACDMFLMPSIYEPCGLNQLYSLKYGTVPIVRATGGLVDTITGATQETIAAGTATGFSFVEKSSLALGEALRQACDLFSNQPDVWRRIVETGMNQDWSWDHSARQYIELYAATVARKKNRQIITSP